jgi:hypothetical protein
MARVVNGNGLPAHVLPLCLALGGLFMLLALLSTVHPPARRWCPSGIGVAVGMYVSPCALFGCVVCTVLYEFFPLFCASQIIRFTGAQGIPEYKNAHSSSLAARACTICLAWAGIWWFVTVCGQQGSSFVPLFGLLCAHGGHLALTPPSAGTHNLPLPWYDAWAVWPCWCGGPGGPLARLGICYRRRRAWCWVRASYPLWWRCWRSTVVHNVCAFTVIT